MSDVIWLVPALPLAGFVVNILLGRRLSRLLVSLAACGTVASAFGLSVGLFFHLIGLPADSRQLQQELLTWIAAGDFQVDAGFLLDPL
jgi:NADH-quinone oxidoreductase subunit L